MSGMFAKAPRVEQFNPAAARKSQEATAQSQAKFGTYGVDSPLGGLSLVQNPDGTYSKQFTESEADVQRGSLIGQGLGALSLDPSRAEEAYYSRATRQLMPQFEQQTEDLERTLINRGIPVGSELYNQELERMRQTQQGTLADISDRSVSAGQSLLGSQIGNIGALSGQRDIFGVNQMGGGTGASMQDTYAQGLQSRQEQQLAQHQAKEQRKEAMGDLAGMLAMSDERLKEDLKPVGKLDNGLIVYVGKYKEETGLDTTPQLFLIAQEVQKIKPEAVAEKDGFLAVNYKEAVK